MISQADPSLRGRIRQRQVALGILAGAVAPKATGDTSGSNQRALYRSSESRETAWASSTSAGGIGKEQSGWLCSRV
jgi:hypothetical protein